MDIPFIISLESAKKIVTPKFIEELEIEWSRTFYSIEAVKRSFQAKLDNINKEYQPKFKQAVRTNDLKLFKTYHLRYFRRIYELLISYENHINEWNKLISRTSGV